MADEEDEGCGEAKVECAAAEEEEDGAAEEECGPPVVVLWERMWASSMAARTSGCWAWYFSRWRANERKLRPQ